jgi:hypothetical protein
MTADSLKGGLGFGKSPCADGLLGLLTYVQKGEHLSGNKAEILGFVKK